MLLPKLIRYFSRDKFYWCFDNVNLIFAVITCVHPLDSFADDHLRFSCSTPRLGYIYGTSCNLSCTANLPLNGSDIITCEDNGKSEGNWSLSGEEPFCRGNDLSCTIFFVEYFIFIYLAWLCLLKLPFIHYETVHIIIPHETYLLYNLM